MKRTGFIQFALIAVLLLSGATTMAQEAALTKAEASSKIAGYSLSKVHRWLHTVALEAFDEETGLYRADTRWNYRDTAADCYPFLVWAAHTVDRDVLNGPVRAALHVEQELCNHYDRIPVPWNFETGKPEIDTDYDQVVFQASEYVKDGLIAIVEVTGPDEWFERMRGIQDDLWARAHIETPHGKIISENIEVNGEQLQALVRLYTMTGDTKYREWAERLAEYYFSDPEFLPNRLRDHGCEIIGGLGLLQAIESVENPEKAARYAKHLNRVYDTILEKGCNEDGMMYNRTIRDGSEAWHEKLSDGWGYNYVGYLCYDMATKTDTYRAQITSTLTNLQKPLYSSYDWENGNIDGWADSVEGGLYLLNRLPVKEGLAWADNEMAKHVYYADEPDKLWGTMKLESNGVRTTLIHALMHTQGLTAHPWQQNLELGAAPHKDGIAIVVSSKEAYSGAIYFDIPRHKVYMGFTQDWPRMNTLPEWFTVDAEATYSVENRSTGTKQLYSGQQLSNGLHITLNPGESQQLIVTP